MPCLIQKHVGIIGIVCTMLTTMPGISPLSQEREKKLLSSNFAQQYEVKGNSSSGCVYVRAHAATAAKLCPLPPARACCDEKMASDWNTSYTRSPA